MDTRPALGQPDDDQHFEVRHWPTAFPNTTPAPRVIALFGARLPESYLAAMAFVPTPPIWINLEYLTAEAWAVGCHGLTSPHPPLIEHFFFPGVSDGTGGVVIEPHLVQERNDFDRARFLHGLNIPDDGKPLISLFCYDTAALDDWLEQWQEGARIVTFITPALPRIAQRLGHTPLTAGDTLQRGGLELIVLPWLSQDDYDRLLWSCDLNIVRGEDSFVRAQLAGRPMLWQPYPQTEEAHLVKLDAWLDHYTHGLSEQQAHTLRTAHHAFSLGHAMQGLAHSLAPHEHALRWRDQILARGDLGAHLLQIR
jgi:uncharacterized repeat protein (TIGR03837 family)